MPTVLVAHPSADLYGSDRVLVESVQGFVEAGARVVVTLPADGPLTILLRTAGAEIEFCPAPVLRKSLMSVRGVFQLAAACASAGVKGWRLVGRLSPDVIYVSTLTIPLWNLIGLARGLRVVVHVHEAEGHASKMIRRLLAAPLLAADLIVTNSRFSADVLAGSFRQLARKTEIVYNGVPGPAQAQPPRDMLGPDLRLVYTGRLSHRKGVDVALEAVSELRSRGISASFDVIGAVFPGNEAYGSWLEREISIRGLDDVVRLHGFQESVWPYLETADAVVVTSRLDEPFGNTAVEAVLAQRPLVVSDTSGLKEAASGYSSVQFVFPGDARSLAAALERLTENWPYWRNAAIDSAPLASAKHDPETYRRHVAEYVLGPSGKGV